MTPNFKCPATGVSCDSDGCKIGFCQAEQHAKREREPHSPLRAITERLIEKLKRTNPKAFRQPH